MNKYVNEYERFRIMIKPLFSHIQIRRMEKEYHKDKDEREVIGYTITSANHTLFSLYIHLDTVRHSPHFLSKEDYILEAPSKYNLPDIAASSAIFIPREIKGEDYLKEL